jgi:hypothetical protein
MTITQAGRQGVTVAYATNSTFNNVDIESGPAAGWDFESDLPNVGSSNVTVNNASGGKGVRLIEALHGPITFNNSNFSGHVILSDRAALSGQPLTFTGGTILLPRSGHPKGPDPAGITVMGPGHATFNRVGDWRRIPDSAQLPGGRPAGNRKRGFDGSRLAGGVRLPSYS